MLGLDAASADAAPPPVETTTQPDYRGIRTLLWIFFWLLLLEGALRKWILPGLSTPLLVVRDPFVLLIYILAITRGIFPLNACILIAAPLAIVGAATAMTTGHGNLYVTLYGLRTNFMYLPLVFIIPKVFTLKDAETVGKWLLISAIPMAVLVLIQFRSSPNAWVNVGAAGAEGSQLEVGFGKIRPPGVFSFTTGLAIYLSLVAAYLFSWLLKKGDVSGRIAYAGILSAGIMIGVSGSRGLLVAVVLIFLGMGYICLRTPAFLGKGVQAGFLLILVFFGLQFRHEFRQGMMIFENRITTGGGVRDGLIYRALSQFAEPLDAVRSTPVFGEGIGLGTTVAGGILYGERKFLLAEGEWARVIKESGPTFGFAYLGIRVAIVVLMMVAGARAVFDENPLPLLLACAVFPHVLNGQWGVSTVLGFACFGAGLTLAAGRLPAAAGHTSPFRVSQNSATNSSHTVRGRSIYAEKLHGR